MKRSPIADQIFEQKYALHEDENIVSMQARVASALALDEKDPSWKNKFFDNMVNFKFIPAGRILAGAGSGRAVTLFNCYVTDDIPDSLSGIFDVVKESAITMQAGGGIGMNFSTIRPKGAFVKGVEADASGPLSFMDVWDSTCKTILSAGQRRGAMMACLRVDHPDIEEFVTAKHDPLRFRNFNCSVLVTDKFMEAVKDDDGFDLTFGEEVHRVDARQLWDKIMRSTYAYAEPGVIFIDRINQRNNLSYCETISATNPCGEQPLPANGACLLGSINMTQFINVPFSTRPEFDRGRFRTAVSTAIRMMDNTIDVSLFPHKAQMDEAKAKRRIGLGMTGVASALAMMKTRYDSKEGRDIVEDWAAELQTSAYWASSGLAVEKGAFPLFDVDAFSKCDTFRMLPLLLQQTIKKTGLRNGLLTSIAPTGTISLLADNVSSGIEPIFALEYTRKVREKDETKREEVVSDYAVRLFRDGHDVDLPDYFVTAQDISPESHVLMQAVVQKYIDSAISKTINVPEGIEFDAFKDVYQLAYDTGCKGVTTYRPNDVTGSVLSVGKEEEVRTHQTVSLASPAVRPMSLTGTTYKLRWPSAAHAFYIIINDHYVDGVRRPFEMFVTSKNIEGSALMTGLTRMVSAVFRRGGDLDFIIEELKAVYDPKGSEWLDGKQVPSMLAAIGGILEQHMYATESWAIEPTGSACPLCGESTLIKQSGCDSCTSCGYSKCG